MYATVTIRPFPGYLSTTGESIRKNVAEHINGLNIGDDVSLSRLYSPANAANAAPTTSSPSRSGRRRRAVRRKRGRRLQRRGVLLGGSRQAGGAAMSGYLGLVTSEHRNRPRFMATVAAVTDPLCGLQELLETIARRL